MVSPTPIISVGLAGGMVDKLSTADCGDPMSYPVVDYVERYSALLPAVILALYVLQVTLRKSVMCIPDGCAIPLWVGGSNDGCIGVDIVQQIHFLIIGAKTISLFVDSRRLGTSEALARSWVLDGRRSS